MKIANKVTTMYNRLLVDLPTLFFGRQTSRLESVTRTVTMSACMLRMMDLLGVLGAGAAAMAVEHTLAVDGLPRATIVTAKNPTPSARLASYELRYHIARISGAILPIVSDGENVVGPCLYVGESAATRDLGLHGADLKPQAYLNRFVPHGLIVISPKT